MLSGHTQNPIGVFDSGLGGLTVLSEVHKTLNHENLIYFGDTARVPYGTKSEETIIRYSEQITRFLTSQGIKMLVIACNTASSYALEHLEKNIQVPVIGVVKPGVDALIRSNKRHNQAALIATHSTIKSRSYERALGQQKSMIKLLSKSCPLFVPLVEEGLFDTKLTEQIIHYYLEEIRKENIQDIILGCTHYPLLKSCIQKLYPEFNLIDSSKEISGELKTQLEKHTLLNQQKTEGTVQLFFSDITDTLLVFKDILFDDKKFPIKKKNLEDK